MQPRVGGVACDDSNPCTTDACAPEAEGAGDDGCTHLAVEDGPNELCVPPDACQVEGACVGGMCTWSPYVCNDDNPCTDDSCEDDGGQPLCNYVDNTAACNDGIDCTTDDVCANGACGGAPSDALCSDDDLCTGTESCDPATGCVDGEELVCDDENACTDDSCDPTDGCIFVTVTCDDGNACTTDSCDETEGCQYEDVVCYDEVACTVDSCDSGSGCVAEPDDGACDDGTVCTDDFCDPETGCGHVPAEGGCDDGDACTVGDACEAGVCVPGVFDEQTCGDWDHDGIASDVDSCPYAFDPAELDLDGDGAKDACEPLSGDFAHQRPLVLTQGGAASTWQRTHEPVEIPLANGILDDSVVGYWKLDGGQAIDYSGNGNHGTVNGATAGDGAFGEADGALVFDGDDDGVEFGSGLPAFDRLALMAWIRPVELLSLEHGAAIVAQNSIASPGFALYLRPGSAAVSPAAVELVVNSAEGKSATVSSLPVPGTKWTHVAATYDGTVTQIYVNGRLSTGDSTLFEDFQGGPILESSAPPYVGKCANCTSMSPDPDFFFDGSIDEVLIFNRALSPDEIETYYRSTAPYGTQYAPGAQADFDDVRITETTGLGDPVNAGTTVKRSRILGPRPHSDTPCPMEQDDGTWKDREDLCGVVAYWRLDGDADDVTGQHDGVNNGATPTRGRFGDGGGAMEFGGDDYIVVDHDTAFEPAAVTVEAWIRPAEETLQGINVIVSNREDGGYGLTAIDGKLVWSVHEAGAGYQMAQFNLTEADVDRWMHVVGTYSNGHSRLFVDGLLVATAELPAGIGYPPQPQPLVIGEEPSQGQPIGLQQFEGTIDEVIIHNVAKSADYIYHRANPGVPKVRFLANTVVQSQGTPEAPAYPLRGYAMHWGDAAATAALPFVSSLADAPDVVPDTCYGLLSGCHGYAGWWRFNEGSGTVAVDSSGWKNNGELVLPEWKSGLDGTAWWLSGGSAGEVGHHPSMDLTRFTIQAEIKPTDLDKNQEHHIVSKGVVGDPDNYNYFLHLDADARAEVSFEHGQGEDIALNSSGPLEGWAWSRVVGLFTGTELRLFTNEEPPAVLQTQLSPAMNGEPLFLGATKGQSFAKHFQGLFDDVRISNRALQPDEFLHYPPVGWEMGAGDWAQDCGGMVCPELDGYTAYCNVKDFCEYARTEPTEDWHQWDVWIYVSPGSFWMGSPDSEAGHQADESPMHEVTFAEGFLIGKYEVVVEQYEACMAANPEKCTPPSTTDWPGTQGTNTSQDGKSAHPQNGLTWQQAKDFCAWVAPSGRLPSEAEWEYAATGPVHRKYPWGDAPEPTCLNGTAVFNEAGGTGGYGCGQGGTWPVGSKIAGAAWCGALDMAGNEGEWNEDWYHNHYEGSPSDGTAWVDPTGTGRSARGGGFSNPSLTMRSSQRAQNAPDWRNANGGGARCVRPLPAACVPDCTGKECGDDGCGGSCGECGAEKSCDAGQCVVTCGDGLCAVTQGETCTNCPGDCGACCPNGQCDNGETCETCAADCGMCGEITPGFVKIPAGSFWMGSPGGEACPVGYTGGGCDGTGEGMTVPEPGRDDDETLHYVELTLDYEMQVQEVTQGEWKAAFEGWNPSVYENEGNYPVETVSWYDACAYANWKSEQAGLTPCYVLSEVKCDDGTTAGDYKQCLNTAKQGIKLAAVSLAGDLAKPYQCEGYRLPTSAEWEYAARAGTLTAYGNGQESDADHLSCEVPFHLTDAAWYCGNNLPPLTKTVGGKPANAWGLKDMAGNVMEWCSDPWDTYQTGSFYMPIVDPYPTCETGGVVEVRGGSISSSAKDCRTAERFHASTNGSQYRGFRLVRTLSPWSCGDGKCNADEFCASCPQDCGDCSGETPGFVKISSGGFWKGSPYGCPGPIGYPGDCTAEPGRGATENLSYVWLSRDFEMQATEVTQDQWRTAFDPTPDQPDSGDEWEAPGFSECKENRPVTWVSWFDSCAYANRRSELAGLVPCYVFTNVKCGDGTTPESYKDCLNSTQAGIVDATITFAENVNKPYLCKGYRLPTEAEWEYAARAGTSTAYHNGQESDPDHLGCEVPFHLANIAWYCGSANPKEARAVGGKAGNAWGLRDMSGNVEEWCADCLASAGGGTPTNPVVDPYAGTGNSQRVVRGGWYGSPATDCRSAARDNSLPSARSWLRGFRLVRTLWCTPDCTGKECGDDGCGGSCGVCGAGTKCVDGTCECVPDCAGKACGDDGCGWSCGVCGAGTECNEQGLCVLVGCQPQCSEKECGDDSCGGTCWPGELPECGANGICLIDNTCYCIPDCKGKKCGDNGCGGSCGTCTGAQEACVDFQCVCQPDCNGKECGTDGCEGSCGTCEDPVYPLCNAGTCECQEGTCGGATPTCLAGNCICENLICGDVCCGAGQICNAADACCTPLCDGKECGPDGCDSTCGTCPAQHVCAGGGQCICIPDCTGKECGDDGCGGSCGECEVGDTCWKQQCTPIECDDGNEVDWDGCTDGVITEWVVRPEPWARAAPFGDGIVLAGGQKALFLDSNLQATLEKSFDVLPIGSGLDIRDVAETMSGHLVILATGYVQGVKSRLFDSAGIATSDLESVDVAGGSEFGGADLTPLPNGQILALWTKKAPDSTVRSIWGRRLSADGEPLDTESLVTPAEEFATDFAAGILSTGSVVIAWNDVNNGDDELHMRLLNPDGSMTDTSTVTDNGPNSKQIEVVCPVSSGFMLAWMNTGPLYVRAYDNSGSPLTVEQKVSYSPLCSAGATQIPIGVQSLPISDGGMRLFWTSQPSTSCGQSLDGSEYAIAMSTFSAEGAQTNIQVLNQFGDGKQFLRGAVQLSSGEHVVVWESPSPTPGPKEVIFAQRFNADGTKKYK